MFLHFFGKIFIAVIAFGILLAPVSTIFRKITHRFNRLGKKSMVIFLMFTAAIFTYLYLFFAAYCSSVYRVFAKKLNPDWLIYIVSALGIILLFVSITQELKKYRRILNERHPYGIKTLMSSEVHDENDVDLIMNITTLKGIWVVVIGFIVFSFLPEWGETLFFGLPKEIAKLWL